MMLRKYIRAISAATLATVATPTLGRCPSHWGGFDSREAVAARNKLRPDTNKFQPHQGAKERERRSGQWWMKRGKR